MTAPILNYRAAAEAAMQAIVDEMAKYGYPISLSEQETRELTDNIEQEILRAIVAIEVADNLNSQLKHPLQSIHDRLLAAFTHSQ